MSLEARGTSAVIDAEEFRNETQFYTPRPFMLNEGHRVSKEDSAIENRLVAMGLASTLLTPKDSEIIRSHFSNELRIDGFHALVVVSILKIFLPCTYIQHLLPLLVLKLVFLFPTRVFKNFWPPR